MSRAADIINRAAGKPSLASRRAFIQSVGAGALVAAMARSPRASGGLLGFPGGSPSNASGSWTPAYYQNFDSYAVGTAGVLNTYGVTAVDNAESYSAPNSGRINIAAGSTQPGGAAEALVANIVPVAGNQVWFRVRTFFPVGFNFTATGAGSGNGLKFLRIETDPIGAHTPAHIDCYLLGGTSTAVGGFDFIYEGQQVWMLAQSATSLPSGIVLGQWQTWEVYYYLSDVAGTAIWRMWRDGTLIMDTSRNIPAGLTQIYNLSSGYSIPNDGSIGGPAGFMHVTYWNGGSPATQEWWIDDFTIATDLVSVPTATDSYGNSYIGMSNTF